jgi:hypothetical protein
VENILIQKNKITQSLHKFVLFVGFLLLFSGVFAAVDSHLFVANIPFHSKTQSDKNLNHIIGQAFNQVLVRVSGNPSVLSVPAIREVGMNPKKYMQSYQKKQLAGDLMQLQVTFNAEQIIDLLRRTGQGLWLQKRPVILCWLLTVRKDKIHLVQNVQLIRSVNKLVAHRGVPLLLPSSLSLEELIKIESLTKEQVLKSKDDFWAKRSLPYQPDHIIVLLHNKQGEIDQGYWRVIQKGQEGLVWQATAKSAKALLNQGLTQYINRLVSKHVQLQDLSMQRDLLLMIHGLHNQEFYLKLIRYLERADVIKYYQIVKDYGHSMLIRVQAQGGYVALRQVLEKHQHLKVLKIRQALKDAVKADLYYRWQ